MKTILLSFTLVILSLTAFAQKKQTDLEFEGLKGKVKSVQDSSTYFGTKGEPVKSPKREYSDIVFYNLNGNISEKINPRIGTKGVYQIVDGFLSVKEVVIDQEKAANIFRTRAIGNAEDMEKPVKTLKPDERFITRFDDEYDDIGRRKLRRIFFSDGTMNSITRYSYNSAGLLEKEAHNSYGNTWSYNYSYDTEGLLKERIMKRSKPGGEVDMSDRTEYKDYKFDAKGNWIERKYIYNRQDDDGSATTSEGIDYRDITYRDEQKPKKPANKGKRSGRGN